MVGYTYDDAMVRSVKTVPVPLARSVSLWEILHPAFPAILNLRFLVSGPWFLVKNSPACFLTRDQRLETNPGCFPGVATAPITPDRAATIRERSGEMSLRR